MRSASFDAIKAVVLSHGNRARAGGTHEAPEEAVVVCLRPNNDDRATTTSPPRDAPSREVPASAIEDAREEPRGIQPRVRRSPRAHASSRGSKRGGVVAGEEDASRRVRAAAAARSAAPASVETTRKTQLAAEEPRLSRRRRRGGPDEDDDEDDDDGGARKTRSATRAKSGERSRAPASTLAASRTPPTVSFASLGVAPPTRLPPTATDAAAVTLAVATGGKDTAGDKTKPTQLSSSSGAREQLARFAAAGAHVGLRATGIPAVAAARLEALARARAAVDASIKGDQG